MEVRNGKETPVAIDRTFQAKNARERERLKALVGRLSEADLRRPVGHGWTVADSLIHLAFWDLRAIILMDRFERDGVTPSPADVDAMNVDVVNETVRALGQAIPPRAAATLAAEAAERVDHRLESLPDRVLEGLGAAGQPFNPTRHVHRAEHLDEIERALR
jgi:Mycothiol maleylpyruvate isomerase N-terminal domain